VRAGSLDSWLVLGQILDVAPPRPCTPTATTPVPPRGSVVGMKARRVLTVAVLFALAMGALDEGSWWWLWLGVASGVAVTEFRLPRLVRLLLAGLTVAAVALAMGALDQGGWWWAWLGVAVGVLLLRSRLHLRRSVLHRYFHHLRRDDRKDRRARRRLARLQRRAMKRHQ
jgi:hypothetical protein